jgi:O-antigen/teichoic acid export membrane protein
MPILKSVLRVVGLNLIIHALYTIQVTRLTALVNFSLQAKIMVSSSLVSGCIGITLAYCGYGVWALVGQTMSAAVFSGIMYWLFTGWRPRFLFSKKSFRELFGFGSKIMAAGFLHTIYMNISPLIIGRKFSAADLGYYSRGDSLAALPGGIFQSTLGRVIFPVLSSIQDDEERLQRTYNKYLRIITSLVAPSMLLLAACAEPLIMLLIGEKWLPCVPYLQLLAIAWVCDPIILVNLNILYVKGRSDVVLKLEIIKKIIAILIVVIAVQYGVIWLCVGRVVYSYIALILNIRYCGPFLKMGFWRQIKEVKAIYISGLLAAFLAFVIVQYTKGLFNIFDSITLVDADCSVTLEGLMVETVGVFNTSEPPRRGQSGWRITGSEYSVKGLARAMIRNY